MATLTQIAVIQSAFGDDSAANVARMSDLVQAAARSGAQIVLLPELFEGRYFPVAQRADHFARAKPLAGHPTVEHFRHLAARLCVVIPVSFFERSGPCYYNSVVVLDADGSTLGCYRKSHIPDGPGYQEKFYFRPGDSGFASFPSRYGTLGVAICWDQWFPEAARAMALAGADILLYPSAIGTEPTDPGLDTKDPWQRVMLGHAVANGVGVAAANRTGNEGAVSFYGHSFIADHRGEKLAEFGANDEGVITASLDLDELHRQRAAFGFFRDRRPELYTTLAK